MLRQLSLILRKKKSQRAPSSRRGKGELSPLPLRLTNSATSALKTSARRHYQKSKAVEQCECIQHGHFDGQVRIVNFSGVGTDQHVVSFAPVELIR